MTAMLRRGARIVVASHNEGKVRELAELFAPYGVECVSATSLGLPEPEENGASFAENAALKAEQAARTSGMIAIADDSGLEVAALGGLPGIHSARWGGQARDFDLAMKRLHCELEANGASDASANFICALALAAPEGRALVFEGKVFGTLTWPPRGALGFGYDPIFVPYGYSQTFGEMARIAKNALSHRMRAFEKLMAATYDDD
jgi:XTP/dITP diphosphohydrolase